MRRKGGDNADDLYVLWVAHFALLRRRRPAPHAAFHVRYQAFKAAIAIEDGRVLAGNLPPRQTKLVIAWAELHQDELMANWELVRNGEEPFRIAPLQ
ncbi:DUF4160 domain-containing protein [Elstera sp.]|jgi:hypothetical protein|uniref:DUF4160 domain-containing protein n=1 Tax=Elstera sp. TaxID=1916664 RepID=UPI0037BEFAA0